MFLSPDLARPIDFSQLRTRFPDTSDLEMAARLPELAELELPEVVDTGRVLGKGAYGEVVEVKVQGMK